MCYTLRLEDFYQSSTDPVVMKQRKDGSNLSELEVFETAVSPTCHFPESSPRGWQSKIAIAIVLVFVLTIIVLGVLKCCFPWLHVWTEFLNFTLEKTYLSTVKDRFYINKLVFEIHDFTEQVKFNTENKRKEICSEVYTITLPDQNAKSKRKEVMFHFSLDWNFPLAENAGANATEWFVLFLHAAKFDKTNRSKVCYISKKCLCYNFAAGSRIPLS